MVLDKGDRAQGAMLFAIKSATNAADALRLSPLLLLLPLLHWQHEARPVAHRAHLRLLPPVRGRLQ